MCKFDPRCAESHGHIELRAFLVTGVGSSGTSWLRSSLRTKGIDAADESWGLYVEDDLGELPTDQPANKSRMKPLSDIRVDPSGGRDGMVSWAARCWTSEAQRSYLSAADDGHGHALFTVAAHVRFRFIVHLVRDPLKAIRSNLFFSDHLRRCEQRTANLDGEKRDCGGGGGGGTCSEYCEVDWWRLSIWEYVSAFTPLGEVSAGADSLLSPPLLAACGLLLPRLTPPRSVSSQILIRALDRVGPVALSSLHWLSWNALVEPVADLTVRLEDGVIVNSKEGATSGNAAAAVYNSSLVAKQGGSAPRTICAWVGSREEGKDWAHVDCTRPDTARSSDTMNSHGGSTRPLLSWRAVELALQNASSALSATPTLKAADSGPRDSS
eukprot:CAMPEP_0171995476 /NCGR_PEP_ID=MMETSP0993-20121228/279490_1 /TAXON_ID=483369 /ORGANISM="non described non described, Strain CCMP2098" /LENGTH=381 /DNA_ID=CAMNT_0012648581 /DNA_START=152 /DNA_END=1294 /DNA_ORIENTATION=+